MAFLGRQIWGRLLILFLFFLFSGTLHAGLKWIYHADSPIVGNPVIKNGVAYSVSESGSLFAIDLSNGNQEYPYALQQGTSFGPQLGSKYLILATDGGLVEAIDTDAGKRAWQYNGGQGAATSRTESPVSGMTGAAHIGAPTTIQPANPNNTIHGIAASGGMVYISYSNRVVALDEGTGKETWIRALAGGGQIGAGQQAIYIAHKGSVSALSKTGGALLWSAKSGETFGTVPSPAITNNYVYVANTQGQVLALDTRNGQVAWAYQTSGWIMSTPAQIGQLVVFGTNGNEVVALDASSGYVRWSAKVDGPVWAKPSGAGENMQSLIVVGANDKYIHAFDPGTGMQVWEYPATDWVFSGAVSQDGRDFVAGTYDGEIMALSLSPMCTISNLVPDQLVGEKFEVSGQAYAFRGIGNVKVMVGRIEFPRISGKSDWTVSVDATPLSDGPVDIWCTATDVSGLEELGRAPKLTVIKSLSAPRLKMSITAPTMVEPGQEVKIYARDSDGYDLKGVLFTVNDNSTEADSPFVFRAPSSDGDYEITARKYGFDQAEGTLAVRTNIGPMLMLVAIIGLGFGAGIFVLMSLLKKK